MIKPPAAGFSLIETVIAIAIAGTAFLVLTETFFNVLLTLEDLETSSDRQKDIRFVRSQVIRIPDPDEVEEGGIITTLDLGEAEWEAEIEPTEIVDLYKMHLSITFENEDDERFFHEENLFLLRPTWLEDSLDRSDLKADVQRAIEDKARDRDW